MIGVDDRRVFRVISGGKARGRLLGSDLGVVVD